MRNLSQELLDIIGKPKSFEFDKYCELVKTYDRGDYTVEVYHQANGKGMYQRLFIAIPKGKKYPLPAVVIPYYFPEGMLGYNPETNEALDYYEPVNYMHQLVLRGYVVASADAIHMTYLGVNQKENFEPWIDEDAALWQAAGEAITSDFPEWTGLGKLVYDTSLMIDRVASDDRVDSSKIAIFGHSLGGIMSFVTGCVDSRVKVILSSDFGMDWDRNNWCDIWYFGDKLNKVKELGLSTSHLLEYAAPKPYMLIAGYYDNDDSFEIMKSAKGYSDNPERLGFINHATGHRPPKNIVEQGYKFLEKWLNM